MKILYKESIGKNWSACGNGFMEQNKTLYINFLKRTFTLSYIWAIDPFGKRVVTPFDTRMNFTAFMYRIGFFKIHISKKQ